LDVQVGGLDHNTQEHIQWITRICGKGEVLQITHVDSGEVSEPISIVRPDPEIDRARQLKYLESTAAELGYALVRL